MTVSCDSDMCHDSDCALQSARAKITSLEESVEAERAAHLESKFNSEIVQVCSLPLS